MSRSVRFLMLALLSAVPAGVVFAQMNAEPAPPTPEQQAEAARNDRQAAMVFKNLDIDGDGFLSREEVALFPRLRDAFDKADADRDGKMSFAEIRVLALQRVAAPAAAATPATVLPAASAAAPAVPPPVAATVVAPAAETAPPAPAPSAEAAPAGAQPPQAGTPPTEQATKKWWWPF